MTSNDIFLGGGTSSGSIINAELPNITSIAPNWSITSQSYNIYHGLYPWSCESYYVNNNKNGWREEQQDGAFYLADKPDLSGTNKTYRSSGYTAYDAKRQFTLGFDASRSNSIYRGSRVIPKHYVIEFWVKFK